MDDSCAADDPDVVALRIQAAAVVAQQAALGEREMRLAEREAALARQEEQVAGRLESQRRQLLDLQDQITSARTALREKRSAHAALTQQQARDLAAAREDAAELQRSAKAERQRLIDLRRRLIQRGRRHWQARRKEAEAREAELCRQADRLDAERRTFTERVEQFNTRAEIDKRRIIDGWTHLERERQEWRDKRKADDAAAAAHARVVARRAKAVAAAERRIAAERADLARELADRRRELDRLETRIGNARLRLLDQQATVLDAGREIEALVARVSNSPTAPSEQEATLQQRAEALAHIADELADQRLHLAEQVELLLLAQQQWHADRTAALRDLDLIGSRFEARELELDRRSREVQAAATAVQAEFQSASQTRLRLEAEQAKADAREADRRAAQDGRSAELEARARALMRQEEGWRSLVRRWGQRRRQEILRLRGEQTLCRQERSEWAAARAVWLGLAAKLRDERQALAVRALAWEQSRADAGAGPAAAKRLERLERQWAAHCESAARGLDRLQATIVAEAARVDDLSQRVRREMLAAEGRAAALDDRAAEIEREHEALAAERARMAGELDVARARQDAAELQTVTLREEAERLARLLIDVEPPAPAAQQSQAA
jgi:hypothetical protein